MLRTILPKIYAHIRGHWLGILIVATIGLGILYINALKENKTLTDILNKQETFVVKIEKMQMVEMDASAYAVGYPYGTVAKAGVPAINFGFIKIDDLNIFTAAVDPKVIPLGSLLYIEDIGLAWATDTGPAIKGMKIDLCMKTISQASKFGRRPVKVCILGKSKPLEDLLK